MREHRPKAHKRVDPFFSCRGVGKCGTALVFGRRGVALPEQGAFGSGEGWYMPRSSPEASNISCAAEGTPVRRHSRLREAGPGPPRDAPKGSTRPESVAAGQATSAGIPSDTHPCRSHRRAQVHPVRPRAGSPKSRVRWPSRIRRQLRVPRPHGAAASRNFCGPSSWADFRRKNSRKRLWYR